MPTLNQGLQSRAEAARYLGTSLRRIHELIHAGELAAVKDGNRIKIATAELERYIRDLPAFEPAS